MRSNFFVKRDLLWWLGLIVFWFSARFILALPGTIKDVTDPSFHRYFDYLVEGIIFSSLGMIMVIFLRNFNNKDKVKEKSVFGIKFVWHTKYKWWWFGMTIFWGVGRSLMEVYHNILPHILINSVKGAIFFALVAVGAGFWEGNPGFFEGGIKKNDNSGDRV
jgi:hypothetical protein